MMWDHLPAEALHEGFECHACGHHATGYQLGELVVDEGWRLHSRGVVTVVHYVRGMSKLLYGTVGGVISITHCKRCRTRLWLTNRGPVCPKCDVR